MHILIIGTGGVGAMAAWRLARAGHQVTALEQFRIGHDRGSSYGESRIIRRVYPDPLYTGLMADAYALWDELQAEWDETEPEKGGELFCKAGGIFFGPDGHPHVTAAEGALQQSGVPFERLDAAALKERFPAFQLPSDTVALYEPSMGYARASDCVYAAVALAKRHGARIIEANPVRWVESLPDGKRVRVMAESGETFVGDHALITAGAWMKPLLERLGVRLPLTVTRQAYLHLEPNAEDADLFEVGRFPVWIDAGTNSYGFPCLGTVEGVKLASHDHGEAVDPDTVERTLNPADREKILNYARERLPGLTERIVYEKVCLYTNTTDEDFVIDTVPGLPEAHFISACSGHGFKFTPLMGQIAADLAVDIPPKYDLSRFRMTRFAA